MSSPCSRASYGATSYVTNSSLDGYAAESAPAQQRKKRASRAREALAACAGLVVLLLGAGCLGRSLWKGESPSLRAGGGTSAADRQGASALFGLRLVATELGVPGMPAGPVGVPPEEIKRHEELLGKHFQHPEGLPEAQQNSCVALRTFGACPFFVSPCVFAATGILTLKWTWPIAMAPAS